MCWNIRDSCVNCDNFCTSDKYHCIICYDIFCKECYNKIKFSNKYGDKCCDYCLDYFADYNYDHSD